MLTCKQACENATYYLEGPTTFSERLSLRFHLLICKHCRGFYRQLKIASGVPAKLESLPEPTDDEIDAILVELKRRSD